IPRFVAPETMAVLPIPVIINARVDDQGDRIIPRRWAGWIGALYHPVAHCGITNTQAVDVAERMATVFSWLWLVHRVAKGIIRYISIAIGRIYDQWVVPKGRVVPRVARHLSESS